MWKSSAFTILEIAVVMAITSLLSALFFNGLNRFNEQLRMETQLKNQVNEYLVFRSNFWRELDSQDSLTISDKGFKLYINRSVVTYTLSDNQLLRNGISLFSSGGPEFSLAKLEQGNFSLSGTWKGRDLRFSYPVYTETASSLNRHFHSEIWPE